MILEQAWCIYLAALLWQLDVVLEAYHDFM